MRIGIFTDTYTPDINGVVSSVVTLQRGLEAAGHEVYIVTGQKNSLHAHREGNVIRMPGVELKKLYGYTLSTPYHFEVKKEVEDLHLDVIHVQQEFSVGIFGRILGHNLHIPVVYTYHTLYEDYTHYVNFFDLNSVEKISKKAVYSLSRYLCNSVSGIIAPSEKTREKLLGYGVTRPIYVIPTGLDLDSFAHEQVSGELCAQVRERHGIRAKERIITYLGRIASEKSIDMIVSGAALIRNPDCRIMIVGGGPSLDELKQQAQREGISDRIIFTGPVPPQEVPAYYAISEAFVSASTSETQGMTFIEALAGGLPIFARPDEVLEGLVEEDVTGFYFTDPQEFAAKADAFLEMDEERVNKMRQAAVERSVQYDMHTFASKVLTVYQMVIDGYHEDYEVTKIRVLDDMVRVTLDNDSLDEPLRLYMTIEDYFRYKVTVHSFMDGSYVASLLEQQEVYKATRSALRRLSSRDYTCMEMRRYLIRNKELSEEEAKTVIADLKARGLLDDARYAMDKTAYYAQNGYGRSKIMRTLLKKGIDRESAEAALAQLGDEDEEEIALVFAQKLLSGIKDRSKKMKKQMIVARLMAQGYSGELARRTAERLELDDDEESEALDKTIAKALRLYASRVEGSRLQQKIVAYCLQKGFPSDMVRQRLEEREWNDNE